MLRNLEYATGCIFWHPFSEIQATTVTTSQMSAPVMPRDGNDYWLHSAWWSTLGSCTPCLMLGIYSKSNTWCQFSCKSNASLHRLCICMALRNHLEAKFDLALGHPVRRSQSPCDQFVDYPDSVSACGAGPIDSPLNMVPGQSTSWWKVKDCFGTVME